MAIKLINILKLKLKNLSITALDPIVERKKIYNEKVVPAKNINEVFKNADVVIISNDNKYFSKLNLNKLSLKMNSNALIYDVWNLYERDRLKLKNNVEYFSLGNQKIT
jgi:UDP-N-acetyl-D-mannosaminuronate dehydrogenase